MQIAAYRKNGGWSFDDASVGLLAEPFVAGIPEMIDILAAQVKTWDQILLTFSLSDFPGALIRLNRTREEFGGNWYRWADREMDGWLCPALSHYFPAAPDTIYIKAERVITL
jgi:hypothetical protein